MRFVTVRELRNQPGAVWRDLSRDDLVLTSNGKPVGVLIGVAEEDLELTLEAIRRSRASLAVTRMRKRAAEAGLDKLEKREIESEIHEVRRGRGGS
jgi:prevent-host-death family protein